MAKQLSPERIERLCLLNMRLEEAGTWANERAEKTLAVYLAGGGHRGKKSGERLSEDCEEEALFKCSIGDQDPAFNPDDEYGNLLAISSSRPQDDDPDDITGSNNVLHQAA